jgi:hypothetical protein
VDLIAHLHLASADGYCPKKSFVPLLSRMSAAAPSLVRGGRSGNAPHAVEGKVRAELFTRTSRVEPRSSG